MVIMEVMMIIAVIMMIDVIQHFEQGVTLRCFESFFHILRVWWPEYASLQEVFKCLCFHVRGIYEQFNEIRPVH